MKGADSSIPGTEDPGVRPALPCAITALLWGSDSDDSNAQMSARRPHKSWHTKKDLPKASGRKREARKTSLVLLPASTAALCSGWRKAPHLEGAAQPWRGAGCLLSCSSTSAGASPPHLHPAYRSALLVLQPPKSFCRAHVCTEQTVKYQPVFPL